jgi:hypothetical protein
MTKNSIILICLLSIATAVSAQNPVTVGVFGYSRVSKPAAKLTIVGNNFGDGSSTLNDVLSIDQFNGDALFSSADRVIVWDAGTDQYTTYAAYDDTGYGGSTIEWRDASDFYGSAVNPVIPVGSAFWIQSSGSVTDTNLVITGDVVATASATNQIVTGFQMLSYPFSTDVDLNETMLEQNATGDALFSSADRVIAWNDVSQAYKTYALYDDTGYGGSTREWRDAGDFYNPAGAISVTLGQGFWYEAQSAFTWVETNKYYGNL